MDTIFLIQLLTSFFIGGLAVGLQTYIAERASNKVVGIILSLPTTQAVGVFFLGIVGGTGAVHEALPVVPLALGGSVLFVTAYVFCSRWNLPKYASISVSALIGFLMWVCIAIPLAVFNFSSFWLSVIGYLVLVTICFYYLVLKLPACAAPPAVHFTPRQMLFRMVFAGGIIALLILCTKLLGPLWGGVLSVFPAAYFSTMLIIHYSRGASMLKRIARGIPSGSPIFIIYALLCTFTFDPFGPLIGTLVAYTALIPFIMILLVVQEKILWSEL